VVDNVRRVLAIEILCAVQGIEYRAPLTPGTGTGRVCAAIRQHVPRLDADRSPAAEIEVVAGMIERGELSNLV
jgi:histidine ammonia-lyase